MTASAAAHALTAVAGITVGHWSDPAAATGCTVVLAPPGGFRASAHVRGRATGTRELDALKPEHLVGHVDAILLTGGSAFGLGAADGVMAWLRERGRGFPVGAAGVVPIVPAAVLFDLGPLGNANVWPGAVQAAQACDRAGTAVEEGSVGVGTGATVGKALGAAGAMKGGVGTWAARAGELVVGALVAVNAFGDVRGPDGAILAGARNPDGGFADARRYLASGAAPSGSFGHAGRNTTLAVVATNASLTKLELAQLASQAADALARHITPFGSAFDGDIVFAASTAQRNAPAVQVECLVHDVAAEALWRAVRLARGTPAVPGLADRS